MVDKPFHQAVACGLVSRVVAPDTLMEEARKLAAKKESAAVWQWSHATVIRDQFKGMTQFSTIKPGTLTNSDTLWVTTTKPSLRAWAAMCKSFTPMG